MAEITPLDRDLVDNITFQFRAYGQSDDNAKSIAAAGKANSDPSGAGFSTSRYNVKFQLPPKVLSDSRSGDWIEKKIPGVEPVAVFKLSGPREIMLEWQYVVGLAGWNTDRVAKTVRGLRSYFAFTSASKSLSVALIVRFRLWNHTGPQIFTCRIKRFDITHGKALVVPPNNPRGAYALVTTVKCDMRLWSNASRTIVSGHLKNADDNVSSDTVIASKVPDVDINVPVEWF